MEERAALDRMTAAERLDEVARILALGILRLQSRQNLKKHNDPKQLRAFGLDFSAEESMHGFKPAQGREGQ